VRPSRTAALWGPGGKRLLLGDAAVLAFFILLSLSFFSLGGARSGAETVEVEVSGENVLTIGRGESGVREVTGPLGTTRIEIRRRQVRILSSPCPLKICQRAGWIGTAGEMLVCLPNEVAVRLPGRPPGLVDALSR
jgi:hypothetical protein